jgi:hypothetical protein
MNGNIASFINFSKTRKGLSQNSPEIEQSYREYVADKNLPQSDFTAEEKNVIREEYISAIQYVLLNLTTPQEREFFKNLDINDDNNLSTIIPLVSSKLKQIALYIARERNKAKFSAIKYNLKGSNFGTIALVKNYIYNLYNDPDFTSLFLTFPSLSSINYLDVGLNYYYSKNVNLYDKDFNVGLENPEVYDGGSYEKLNLLYFNEDLYLPALSSNIVAEFNSLKPIFLATNNNKVIVVNNKQRLQIKYRSTNIQNLDSKYFLYGEKTEENLIFNIIKNGVAGAQERYGSNKFLGNNLVYVSGANASTPLTGALVEAAQKYGNLLNYRNYTLQAIENLTDLKRLTEIGGFFLPSKQGLSIALSKHYNYFLNTTLTGVNYTVDPNYAVNPRGNSKLEYPNVYYFSENAAWIINDISGQYNWGYIKDTRPYQKFFGYQSYEEVNYEYRSGINKVTDSFDFFTGSEKNVWANKDVYPSQIGNPLPIDSRQESYNTTIEDIYRWQSDIYGNNFALYKRLNNYGEIISGMTLYNNPSAFDLTDFLPISGVITASDQPVFLNTNSQFGTTFESLDQTQQYNSINEKDQKLGEVYVRSYNNTALKTLSDAFSAVFSKYNSAVKVEIETSVKTFNIINDVIIVKTTNYNIMERYLYNIDEDSFAPYFTFRTELQ